MNEAENQAKSQAEALKNQVFHPDTQEDTVQPGAQPSAADRKAILDSIAQGEAEVIRDLVTPQTLDTTTGDDDRSPTKTERPLPLDVIQQIFAESEATDLADAAQRTLIDSEG